MARGRAGGSGERVTVGSVLRARRRVGSSLYAVLVIASVALVVAMSTRFRLMADLSRGAENTLSPQTMQALSSLDEDLDLHALFTSKEPRRDAYFYLLMRYQTASAHVKVRFVDPVARPGVVKELGVDSSEEGQRRDGMTVAVRGSRRMVFRGVEEEDVTNAILEVGSKGRRIVGFLRGYGEHDPGSASENGFSKAVDALRQEYYDARDITLAEEIPREVTALVAAGPSMPIPPAELDRLARWLERGGRLLALLDPGEQTGLEGVLEPWGLRASGAQIFDAKDNLNRDPRFVKVTQYGQHPIGRGFGKNYPTAFPLAQMVSHFEPPDPEVFHDDVAKAGDYAIAEAPDGKRTQGPFCIAAASWKRLEKKGVDAETRIVLVGDSDFASNLYLPGGANRNFFLNAMGWLSREQGLVSIRRQPLAGQALDLSAADRQMIFLVVFASPLFVILAGFMMFVRRRRL